MLRDVFSSPLSLLIITGPGASWVYGRWNQMHECLSRSLPCRSPGSRSSMNDERRSAGFTFSEVSHFPTHAFKDSWTPARIGSVCRNAYLSWPYCAWQANFERSLCLLEDKTARPNLGLSSPLVLRGPLSPLVEQKVFDNGLQHSGSHEKGNTAITEPSEWPEIASLRLLDQWHCVPSDNLGPGTPDGRANGRGLLRTPTAPFSKAEVDMFAGTYPGYVTEIADI